MMVDEVAVKSAGDILRKATNDISTLFGRPVLVMFEFTDIELVSQSKIIHVVSEVTGVSFAEMVSRTKTNRLTFARYHVFKLMREHLRLTVGYIGKAFDRDHSTVVVALDVFKNMYKMDASFRKTHDLITRKLFGDESNAEADK